MGSFFVPMKSEDPPFRRVSAWCREEDLNLYGVAPTGS